VPCIGSPFPNVVNVVILAHAIPVASRPRAMSVQMSIFSEVLRFSVRMSRIGIKERARSVAMYIAVTVSKDLSNSVHEHTSNCPSVIDDGLDIPALGTRYPLPV
jgi:hypothetical protein